MSPDHEWCRPKKLQDVTGRREKTHVSNPDQPTITSGFFETLYSAECSDHLCPLSILPRPAWNILGTGGWRSNKHGVFGNAPGGGGEGGYQEDVRVGPFGVCEAPQTPFYRLTASKPRTALSVTLEGTSWGGLRV